MKNKNSISNRHMLLFWSVRLFPLLLTLCPLITWADEWKDPQTNVIYEFNPGETTAQVRAGRYSAGSPNAKGDITILAKITVGGQEYDVTSIGESAFIDCSNLTSVIIPSSVTWIGERAFYNCQSLKSVTTPMGVRGVGLYTFAECKKLTSISLPNSVTYIGDNAFENCNGLTSITLSENLTSIGDNVFHNCRSLGSFTIPNSVTSIGYSAFSGCSNMTVIIIPAGVTSIGDEVFYGCSGLTSITIPSNVTNISSSAFKGCRGLTSVTIEEGVTSIGDEAFYGCRGLTSVTIPSSVTSIGDEAFYGCSGLTSVTIPNSVTNIGSSAFEGCNGLTSITIPSSVISIGKRAFDSCQHLTSITIPGSVTSIGDYAFSSCSSLTSVTVCQGVISIGSCAFNYCSRLSTVTIPSSVTSIGESAFSLCRSLTAVHIDDLESWCAIDFESGDYDYDYNIHAPEYDYFSNPLSYAHRLYVNGKEITELHIPYNVMKINDGAFVGCSNLKSIVLPESLTLIGDGAFAGCKQVTDIYCNKTSALTYTYDAKRKVWNVPSSESGDAYVWEDDPSEEVLDWISRQERYYNSPDSLGYWLWRYGFDPQIITLHVPAVSIDSYTEVEPWSRCKKIVALEDVEVDGINYRLSYTNKTAKVIRREEAYSGNIVIPSFIEVDGVTYTVNRIDNYAFQSCENLTSIVIPESVISIGGAAFEYCKGLSDIIIPRNVTMISGWTFASCSGLKTVHIPNSVTSVRSSAFRGCTALTDVYIEATNVPNTVNDAFDKVNLSAVSLHVPASAFKAYKATEPWSNFGSIVAMPEKCAIPTITYAEGSLTFQSATQDAECVTTITDNDIKTHYGNHIELSVTYLLTVYARAEGYENSDVVTATLCWIDAVPNINCSEDITVDVAEVKANPVLIQNQGNIISIDGVEAGTPISVYDIEGRLVGSSTADDGTTQINTHLTTGQIAIVRMGNRNIKVLLH